MLDGLFIYCATLRYFITRYGHDALSLPHVPVSQTFQSNQGHSPHNPFTTLEVRKLILVLHYHPIPSSSIALTMFLFAFEVRIQSSINIFKAYIEINDLWKRTSYQNNCSQLVIFNMICKLLCHQIWYPPIVTSLTSKSRHFHITQEQVTKNTEKKENVFLKGLRQLIHFYSSNLWVNKICEYFNFYCILVSEENVF